MPPISKILVVAIPCAVIPLNAIVFPMVSEEGYDVSVSGWTTDYALCTLCLMLILPSIKKNLSLEWTYFLCATSVSFLYGGLSHHLFVNGAGDGSGMREHYLVLIVSWGAMVTRILIGWEASLPIWFTILVLVLFLIYLSSVAWTLFEMTPTGLRRDDLPQPSTWNYPPYYYSMYVSQVGISICDAGAVLLWRKSTLVIIYHVLSWCCVGWLQMSYHILQMCAIGQRHIEHLI